MIAVSIFNISSTQTMYWVQRRCEHNYFVLHLELRQADTTTHMLEAPCNVRSVRVLMCLLCCMSRWTRTPF